MRPDATQPVPAAPSWLGGILRTATFRLAAALSVAFAVFALLLFGFIYWQTALQQTRQVDRFLLHEAKRLVALPSAAMLQAVNTEREELHHLTFATVFDQNHRAVSGPLTFWPPGFPANGKPHEFQAANGHPVRAVGMVLQDDRILLVGRDIFALAVLRRVVAHALLLGLIPALLLSLAVGAALSSRTQARLRMVHQAITHIMRGNLHERLPLRGAHDDLDRLIAGVNAMLDELERLVRQLHSAGDAIAHDLRTPLARLRARLERARTAHADDPALVTDAAICDLDQALTMIAALLRLGDIEAGYHRAGFAPLDPLLLATEAVEMYQPLAEEKNLTLRLESDPRDPTQIIFGDRDLLLETVANLLDNAVKFTSSSGIITVRLDQQNQQTIITVQDTGPGIDPALQNKIFERFMRADGSRAAVGSGLGLSIVAAILRLHKFTISVRNLEPGCAFTITCPIPKPAA